MLHSITSSARASSVGDRSRPSACAVIRLTTKSNLVAAKWQDFLLLLGRVLLGWDLYSERLAQALMDIPAFVAPIPRRVLPTFLGYIAPFVEFVGGILLVVGLGGLVTVPLPVSGSSSRAKTKPHRLGWTGGASRPLWIGG
jgi:hypothetical protein